MNDIPRIIEKYTNQNESIMAHPDLARDIQLISSLMPKASAEDKQQAEDFLSAMADRITKEIATLKAKLDNKPDAMSIIQKNSEACLAYLKPEGRKG